MQGTKARKDREWLVDLDRDVHLVNEGVRSNRTHDQVTLLRTQFEAVMSLARHSERAGNVSMLCVLDMMIPARTLVNFC